MIWGSMHFTVLLVGEGSVCGWVAKRRLVKKLGFRCNSFESQDGEIIHRDYKKACTQI